MIKKSILSLLFLALFALQATAQTLTNEERKLYDIMMDHRKQKGLPSIPLSPSLTIVAQTHVKDLVENAPNSGKCNMHSWSAKGKWTLVCYTSDHANAKGMWSKPSELTCYKNDGFEIAFWTSEQATAIDSLNGWKGSSGHNEVMVNEGIWKDMNWQAVGIGIYRGFAVAWFGVAPDVAK